jgi:hypothetical protein
MMPLPSPISGLSPASEPAVRPVEVREEGGRLLRKISSSGANELVRHGFAEWRRASNGRWFVHMKIEISETHQGAGPSVTTVGRQDHIKHHPRCGDWGSQNSRNSEARSTT